MSRSDAATLLNQARWRLDQVMRPADPELVTEIIRKIALALQVTPPEGEGLLVYVGLLQSVPAVALRLGVHGLMKGFAYPRLPFPAEILSATGAAHAELMFWHQSIVRAQALLEKPADG